MFTIKRVKVHSYEQGFLFRDGEFERRLEPGRHWIISLFKKVKVQVTDCRTPWLSHPDLDLIVKSGALADKAIVLDLKDHERALIWIDGRFKAIVPQGLFALWNTHREIKVEIVDTRKPCFDHTHKTAILKSSSARDYLEEMIVPEDTVGVYFQDGKFDSVLGPGRYCFWKKTEPYRVEMVKTTEQSLDISGQEIMTADKVTLRLNALVTFRITDSRQAVCKTGDLTQALYRQAQLMLREIVGTQSLDNLLTDKENLTETWQQQLQTWAQAYSLELVSAGIRDIILPGDMKDLMNKVTEAKKMAEANLIVRREETAAMRSQANTAKLLENNPVLMRLRELEILEKLTSNSKLSVVLGEKGLADRVVNLL